MAHAHEGKRDRPRLILVLGGARSGKSGYAESLAARIAQQRPVFYVATATAEGLRRVGESLAGQGGKEAMQLRVAEVLKPLVIWEPQLIPAFVLGNFLSNLGSPYAGPWELGWMPFANLVGAWACWRLGRRNPYLGAAAYAAVVALAVATMLSSLLHARFRVLLPPLLGSEVLLLLIGVPVMYPVHLALRRVFGGNAGTR